MRLDEPFVPRSFALVSPSGKERIYTTLSPTRILLTANTVAVDTQKENGVVMGVLLDESPKIRVGTHLLSLGVPVFGIITGLFPVPSVDGKFRCIINYHPLSKQIWKMPTTGG